MRNAKDFLGSPGLSRFTAGAGPQITMRGADFESTVQDEVSFRNEQPGSALKSTQQIPLDWSKFENHTFFSSAEVSVNVAFNNIINGFPFDGTKDEIDTFLDGLTGFEKWIYDQFPKRRGTLHFRNSYISINDIPGSTFQEISRKKDGRPVLDPGNGSISFQFNACFPEQINENQVILQRTSGLNGYTLAISKSNSTSFCDLIFIATSGSAALTASCPVKKGEWLNIETSFNRKPLFNKLFIHVDGKLASTSSKSHEFYEFSTIGSSLTIGTGSSHSFKNTSFLPISTLSASIDNFKVFHKSRTTEEIQSSLYKNQYPEESLKMFLKFNEPSGSYSQKSLVLDSSTNGLHSNIIGYSNSLRSDPDGLPNVKERRYESPVLFPDYQELVSLNQVLLLSASFYDEINPNLITKLVPPHYFFEGRLESGFSTDEGPVSEYYNETGTIPGQSKLGSSQILSALLYIWAKQFDELKIFLDHFSKIESFEYKDIGSIADQFLVHQARNIGIELPQLFTTLVPSDEDTGEQFGTDPNVDGMSIQEIQAHIWRRLLASSSSIFKSKGTISSIKELIRAFGVNPDTSIRLREYGGAREGVIESRKARRLSFGKLTTNDYQYAITSPFLSSSRIEPGEPRISGNFVNGCSDSQSDGLLTTGSWTYEATYRFPEQTVWEEQSLVRFYVTGSSGESLSLNLVARSSGSNREGTTLTLYGSTDSINSNNFVIETSKCNIFDGDRWHLSIGRKKNSSFESKFFLRAGKQMSGQITDAFESAQYVTYSNPSGDIFSNIGNLNSSGSYFRIGNYGSHNSNSLIDTSSTPEANPSSFSGEISSLKFYSKNMEGSEWYEHILNSETLGVKDPLVNFNFTEYESGSFERLRIDVSFDQTNKNADSLGNISFFDYSQNEFHLSGSSFNPNSTVLSFDDVIFSSLDPKFDERSIDNKVRIRSWQEFENVQSLGGEIAPVYEVPRYEEGADDTRFGVEISIAQALNEDIIKMFSDFSSIDNAIGSTSDLFDDSYQDLESLRDVYFNRLTSDPEYTNVILFSKWFESSMSRLIEQFLPSNTKFLGVNLVVESHMLERAKMRYHWGDLYLGENDRRGLRGTIGLSQLVALVRRF
jgi:hypothetical protein